MKELTFDNAFLGAKILKGKEEFFIYKINQKSLYYGKLPYSTIATRWESKDVNTTWKALMENASAINSNYDDLLLSDEQTEEKEVKKASDIKKEKKYLSSFSEKEVARLYERFVKGKGSWAHQVEVSKELFNIVAAQKDGTVLLSVDDSFVFYNVNTKKYVFWRPIGFQYGPSKPIPWPTEGAAA